MFQALEEVAKIIKKTALLNIIKISDEIIYDPINKTVKVFNTLSRLTVSENKLLELLLLNRGNVVTKEMVEEKIYIFKEMSDTALKNIIYKLRKKLVKDVIKSVDKLGYTID
ncbi:MAG: winged helix-turn-helix domain-containing protein [Aliarcobacter sp.]